MKKGLIFLGCGTTIVTTILLGIWLGQRYGHPLAGILGGFAAALLFLYSAARESSKL
ncbi:MAG: hypothetical protein IKE21_06025 [Erysipelotrichaceae bacterium]|nr:hypothetical protein [Erysipelotrichaceae bacterium]